MLAVAVQLNYIVVSGTQSVFVPGLDGGAVPQLGGMSEGVDLVVFQDVQGGIGGSVVDRQDIGVDFFGFPLEARQERGEVLGLVMRGNDD